MKRRIAAGLSVLFALAGTAAAQDVLRLPEVGGTPAPNAGRAIVVSPDDPVKIGEGAEKPAEEKKEALPPPTIQPVPATNACNNTQPPKKSFLDCHAGPPEQFWAKASYLYWQVSDLPIPMVLGQTNTGQTLGATTIDFGTFSGGKFEAGLWLGCQHIDGIEVGGFLLQKRDQSATLMNGPTMMNGPVMMNGPAMMQIFRPTFDVSNDNQPFNYVVFGQGFTAGRLTVSTSSQLGSLEGNYARNLFFNGGWSFDALAGVRYIDLQEDLHIAQDTTSATPNLQVNTATEFNRLQINDRFRTRNQMYAGQIGGRAEYRSGVWFGTFTGKLAMGPNQQTSEITGETIGFRPDGTTVTGAGGILAVPGGNTILAGTDPVTGQPIFGPAPLANGGTRRTDWFAIAPEVGVQLGAQITRSARVHVGYNFLYVNNVVRPGDLIDVFVNPKFVPSSNKYGTPTGADRPAPRTSRDDFIAHGVEFGLQVQF